MPVLLQVRKQFSFPDALISDIPARPDPRSQQTRALKTQGAQSRRPAETGGSGGPVCPADRSCGLGVGGPGGPLVHPAPGFCFYLGAVWDALNLDPVSLSSFLLFHFCNSSELNSATFSRPAPAPSLLKVVSPPAQALKGEAEVRGEGVRWETLGPRFGGEGLRG